MRDGQIRTAGSEGSSGIPPLITIRGDFLWAFGMNCNRTKLEAAGYALLAILSLFSLTCQESLPTYVFPANIMSFDVKTIEQLRNPIARPSHELVHVDRTGTNSS